MLGHCYLFILQEARFGPEKATPLNVYVVMKFGINGVDSNGSIGPIRSRKVQKRVVCMFNTDSTLIQILF